MAESNVQVLFGSSNDDPVAWGKALRRAFPPIELRVWPDIGEADRIEAALVWEFEAGRLKDFPNLKGIVSLGAGIEHLTSDPELPDVPIARIIDPVVTAQMSEYAIFSVLRHHRLMPAYAADEAAGRWVPQAPPHTAGTTVGILGLGIIGRDIAAKLQTIGFRVLGWSRTEKSLPDVRCFAGEAGLLAMLAEIQMLVCILPLTPQTRRIIDARALAALPSGAFVINFARGGHVVEDDLLAAVESGHIAGAMLDVFAEEPLPPGHPFWAHPRITVTPHIAAIGLAEDAAPQVAENIRRALAGERLINQIDRTLGY